MIKLKNKIMGLLSTTRYATSVFISIVKPIEKKHCTCCGHTGMFSTAGSPPRYNARCRYCGSFERHRLMMLADTKFDFFSDKSVLHFAPEPVVTDIVKKRTKNYISADLEEGIADKVFDIENIDNNNDQWDVILCLHVLEHVDDDKSLSELYRVLKDDGVLLIMVPVIEGWEHTYENKLVKTEEGREKHFGQSDHVRYYGRDIRDRIQKKNFTIEEYTAYGDDVIKHGLIRGEKLFICRKVN